ncbi:Haloacid dehalogenase type II [Penicillium chermesinum]|uniref:Haloacid dehalogenase type II n=1 Tax=Penicillium chermesinum TaxID=63820 RepID=A0A9W9PID8_9EURO|nr:Haloacid dehalogenase type II [Penicillium chermesinum]KAJ5247381.1 Haloacid dehalogenase type II [Penicillium chermesinum]KAJ6145623.1 Haloacid dehalogenase type II [Penicillium chermesinum]
MPRLTDYRLLCFDVYGTLIDWEGGILEALQPILSASGQPFTREHLLTVYQELESNQQRLTPDMPYSQLLSAVHPALAERLGLPTPSEEQSKRFGESIGSWPAFPDTVEALHRLRKHYKLVVLSNVDKASFAKSNAGSLQGFPFDQILTAQEIGSYKPDARNFAYMKKAVQASFGIEPSQILQTAQSQFHDHQPAREAGIKSVWIVRPGATMGNTPDPIFDWRFDTLGAMADALQEGHV